MTDLRLGDWREVLADIDRCDSIICDPPYSARTHGGFLSSAETAINYAAIMQTDAVDLARSWAPRVERWAVIFGDHISSAWHRDAWVAEGWCIFAPVVWVKKGASPRFRGDGPASSCEYLTIARRKGIDPDGSRPGHYMVGSPRENFRGQKDLDGMRALVRDYSRPGDLIVDPFCGCGTTALAAEIEGRRCITTEIDPKTYAKAKRRLEAPRTKEMFDV